ncbi:MAG: ATP-binding cassette domain-containing protein [Mycoplasmatales bacterium]
MIKYRILPYIVDEKTILNESMIEFSSFGIYKVQGKNGAGKTTLLNQLFFANKEYNNSMSYCIQNAEIVNIYMNVLSYLTVDDKSRRKEVIENLEKYNIDYILNWDIKKLSGGQTRFIQTLKYLFSQARIILLDEPFNDIDDNAVEILITIINDLATESILIIVDHHPYFQRLNYQEILIIEGDIIFKGPKESNGKMDSNIELLNSRRLRKKTSCIHQKLYIAFGILLLFTMYFFSTIFIYIKEENMVDTLNENYIYTIASSNIKIDEAMPLELYECMQSDVDVVQKYLCINKYKDIFAKDTKKIFLKNSPEIKYILELASNDLREYIDLPTKVMEEKYSEVMSIDDSIDMSKVYPLDESNYSIESTDTIIVGSDVSKDRVEQLEKEFSIEKNADINGVIFSFDENYYKKNSNNLSGYQIVSARIDNKSASEIRKEFGDNLIISNSNTKKVFEAIKNIQNQFNILQQILLTVVVLILFCILFLLNIRKVANEKLKIYYHFGYSKKELCQAYANNRNTIITIILILLLYLLLMLNDYAYKNEFTIVYIILLYIFFKVIRRNILKVVSKI